MAQLNRNVNLEEIDSDALFGIDALKNQIIEYMDILGIKVEKEEEILDADIEKLIEENNE